MNKDKKRKILHYFLGALQAFIGISAIAGGFGLITDPSGAKMKLELGWLADSPFSDYWIPGLVLFSFVGLGNFTASIATFFHSRHTNPLAFLLGAFLILFLMVEVWYVGLKNPLQPLFFVLGGIELTFGLKLMRFVKSGHESLPAPTIHTP